MSAAPSAQASRNNKEQEGQEATNVAAAATTLLSSPDNLLQFPPFPPGSISVPKGKYLAPFTRSVEPGGSQFSLCGFPLLASSSYLVQIVKDEVQALFDDFAREWLKAVDIVKESTKECQRVHNLSPFAIFRDLYTKRGWHMWQMYWSEHLETRSSIYQTIVRVTTDQLRTITGATDAAVDRDSTKEALTACSVLFTLKLFQSTTAIGASDTAFRSPIATRIPIEADLYQILLRLPVMAKDCMALPEWAIGEGLQPIDDVTFILMDLTGELSSDERLKLPDTIDDQSREASDSIQKSTNVFDVLSPTEYEARPALVSNHLSTKSNTDRKKQTWGQMRVYGNEGEMEGEGETIGLTRAESIRNLLKQRLGLPLREPLDISLLEGVSAGQSNLYREGRNVELLPHKQENRGRHKSKIGVVFPPSELNEDSLEKCMQQVADIGSRYEASKRQRIEGTSLDTMLDTNIDNLSEAERRLETSSKLTIQSIIGTAKHKIMQDIRSSIANQRETLPPS